MKFTVSRSRILAELNLLQGIVERKGTIPILGNILIEAVDASEITLIATDLDISMQCRCPSDIVTPGAVVLNAKKLFDIVRSLPDSEIVFAREDGDWVSITCGRSRFRMIGHAKEHYPSIPEPRPLDVAGRCRIKTKDLHSMISRTIYAITQEESRYALNGALLLIAGQDIKLITTDGHRLAMAGCASEAPFEDVRVIVPKKALAELLKLLSVTEDTVEFSKDENHLFFGAGARRLTSRTLAGQFPNYEIVVPKGNDKIVSLQLDTLAQAIRRAALMADERSHGVKLDFENGGIEITSQTADLGEAHETVAVDYHGEKLTVKFNAAYVLDFLSVVDTDQVLLEMKNEQTPVLFRPAEGSKYDYKYVVMPMRL
ncbi:MAG TPA: DNA polymerase III subunit beta [Blastocatellia bacterium]|nr:DNA polymerase III subunit beta [Blastocatellia bacterium]